MSSKRLLFPAIAVLLAAVFGFGASAQTLEVDTASPDFKVESYQYNPDNDEENYWENIMAATPTTVDAGVEKSEIKRFAASLKVGVEGIIGDPPVTFINGSATLNAVIPFKEAAVLESFSLKFTVDSSRYFFTPYVSMDGKTWVEAPMGGAAEKVTIAETYGTSGEIDGPGVECYASTPAGRAADNDINIITVKLDKPTEAKYLKLTFFGNDSGKGELTVANQWISFNSFKAEGTVIPQAAGAGSEGPTDSAGSEAQAVTAPKTGDTVAASVILLIASLFSFGMLRKTALTNRSI